MKSPGIHLKKAPFSTAHVNKLIDSKNYDSAEKVLRKELKKKPSNQEALYLLGVTLWSQENHKGALVFLQRARANASNQQQKYLSTLALCNVHDAQKNHKLAIQLAKKELSGNYEPNKLTIKLINLYLKAECWNEIREIVCALMPFRSSNFEALKMICLCHQAMDELDEAINLALEQRGNLPEANILLTQFYNELGDFDKTEPLLREALKSKPGDSHLNSSLANLLGFQGKFDEANGLLTSVSESNNIHHIKWALGTLNLAVGNFEEGHRLIEARYKDHLYRSKANLLQVIDFSGGFSEAVGNILLSQEEGVGDQIRHAKYLSMLPVEESSKVYVNCEDRLMPLFEKNFPALKFIHSQNLNLAYMAKHSITHQALLASTYFLAGKKMQQAEAAYLKVEPEGHLIPETKKIKIGLCWRSVKVQLDRTLWYMPLEQVAALFKDIDCELVSLQNDVNADELAIIKKHSGKDLIVTDIDAKDDFLGLSQLINETDLVVSTATATSELAGALGKKTWVIGNKHPVRWYLSQVYMDHFYPDMKLYLSTQAFDWASVASQVEGDLKVYVEGRGK